MCALVMARLRPHAGAIRTARSTTILMECVILIGLPGSGKTTFYRQRFAETHAHVSKDLMPKASNKQARQLRALSELLAAGTSVVADNTNATVQERAALIALAHAHGARVVGYYLDVTVKDAIARNAGREGKSRVPNVAIYTIAKRLVPPMLDEGFDEL